MKIKFWGVRGSVPTPGPKTVRYGGNTTCIEVRGDNGTLAILDAGTGIRLLGDGLADEPPGEIHLFLTHTHWDHIHGFPFFRPAYRANNIIHIYGPYNAEKNLRETLSQQMIYSYWPVHADELQASIIFHNIDEEPFEAGEFLVTPKLMNHPITCLGYRLEEKGKKVVYTGDHEQLYDFRNNEGGDKIAQKHEGMVRNERRHDDLDFVQEVDVLIIDAQYLDEEYPSKTGWGHSTISQCVDLAVKGKVKHIVLFHHEPTRSDDDMDKILAIAKKMCKDRGSEGLVVTAAIEGDEIAV